MLIWAHGDVYATRPPDESYPIHQDNGGGWIVREDVARKLLAVGLRQVEFLLLPIQDPVDGLVIPDEDSAPS